MTSSSDQHDIKSLQNRVEDAAVEQRTRPQRLSRAARLHLIDILSRWSGSGLGIIAGVSIYAAVAGGRANPVRAGVWLLIMMAALYICRRLRSDFRAGAKSASKPFRWRANYTASLSVLSAAFGAGGLLLTHETIAVGDAVQLASLILLASLIAASLHIAHGRTAAAVLAPASLFVIASVWRSAGAGLAFLGAGAIVALGAIALYVASRQLQASASLRYPRSRFLRRSSGEERDALEPAYTTAVEAQAG